MPSDLQRDIFAAPQSGEYFLPDKLQAMTGQPVQRFAAVVIKELLDNALDAAEKRRLPPVLSIRLRTGRRTVRLVVADNGAGMSPETVRSLLNFQTRTSDKIGYRGPTRGAQGNALKTVLGIPYALGCRGSVVIESEGVRHILRPSINPAGEADVDCTHLDVARRAGTTVAVELPVDQIRAARPVWWARAFSLFNPHASIRICKSAARGEQANSDPVRQRNFYRSAVQFPAPWKKFLPTDNTSAWWYSDANLAQLIFLKIAKAERSGRKPDTLREFVREFRGLTHVQKAKAVCDQFPDVDRLDGFRRRETLIPKLLAAMQERATPPSAGVLGFVGEDHFRERLHRWFGVRSGRWWYKRKAGVVCGTAFVVEAALAVVERGPGGFFHGVNFSVAYEDPLTRARLIAPDEFTGYGVESFMGRCCTGGGAERQGGPPVVCVFHLIYPSPPFLDKGKTRLNVPDDVVDAASAALWAVGKQLYGEEKRRRKDAARQERADRRRDRGAGSRDEALIDAVAIVMRDAVAKASGGLSPVSAHTLYYVVRAMIQEHTERELTSGYFEQTLLPEYQQRHGVTLLPDGKTPAIYYEPRGVLYEPHSGVELPLGTREVEAYEFPEWRYNKILFIEKKGLWPVLKAARLAERYDMAIIAGEGYSCEACRRLFLRADDARTYQMFVVHDADPSGYNIARTLREETRRMPGYRADVQDLGLKLDDALRLGLQTEDFTRRKALPQELELNDLERECFEGEQASFGKEPTWKCRRVELNAFTNPDLIAFINRQLLEHGAADKVVPPPEVLGDRLASTLRDELRRRMEEEVLRDANLDSRVEEALERLAAPLRARVTTLPADVASTLKEQPTGRWEDAVADAAGELADDEVFDAGRE